MLALLLISEVIDSGLRWSEAGSRYAIDVTTRRNFSHVMEFDRDEGKRLSNIERDAGATIRIISLRKALSHEHEAFEEILGN